MFKCLFYMHIAVICMNCAICKRQNRAIIFLDTQVVYEPKYLSEHSVEVKENGTSLGVVLNVAQNFTRDPWVEFILSLKKPKEHKFRSMVKYDVNACTLLGKYSEGGLNLAVLWASNVLKYGNLPKSCPILKGNYFWPNFKVDKLSIPPFLLLGKYRINMYSYFQKDEEKHSRDSVANLTILIQVK